MMTVSYPLFLVAFSIEVDAKGEEAGSLSRGIQEIPPYNRMHRGFRMRDQLAQVALPGLPASMSVIGTRQGGPDEPAGRDRECGQARRPALEREGPRKHRAGFGEIVRNVTTMGPTIDDDPDNAGR